MSESTEPLLEGSTLADAWARRGSVLQDSNLLGATDDWLHAIPLANRPSQLPREFPRIANELARLWPTQPELDRYFEELGSTARDGRLGFDPVIRDELNVLQLYYLNIRMAAYERPARKRWLR